MSARGAMLFAAKALPDNPAEQVVYYTLSSGLVEPMHRMLDQCSTVEVTPTRPSPASRAGSAAASRCGAGRPAIRRGRRGVCGVGSRAR